MELKKIENIELVWIQNITNVVVPEIDSEVIRFTINTFWNIEPFIEGIDKKAETEEEDTLDSELEQLES